MWKLKNSMIFSIRKHCQILFSKVDSSLSDFLKNYPGLSHIVSPVLDLTLGLPLLPGATPLISVKSYDSEIDTNLLCLGYADESVSPPLWKCEDRTLMPVNLFDNDDIYLQGSTTHFTKFAILLAPPLEEEKEGNEETNEGGVSQDTPEYWIYILVGVVGVVVVIGLIVGMILYWNKRKEERQENEDLKI